MNAAPAAPTSRLTPGIGAALGSALLFGVTTPIAKHLSSTVDPWLLAGLLYAGSGIGIGVLLLPRLSRARSHDSAVPLGMRRSEIPWLAASIVAGGITAPVLLMLGLRRADAAVSSLLLNLELVFTALIAWIVFREATSRRIASGLGVIVLGGVLLAWPSQRPGHGGVIALLAVAGACLCWALDNNLTRRISAADARLIAGIKGVTAGATNITLALLLGAALPSGGYLASALLLGFVGYGLSLVLFIVALRELGTARTSAYFAAAPFVGAGVAILLYGEPGGGVFWPGCACMAAGIWLHVTESHAHEHVHEPLTHTHAHTHDVHHQHPHPPGLDLTEPHVHEHVHAPLRHTHPHFPDIHHRHDH
ncbi:MAG TPA: EamA family transporter [Steroidobacteraceae bacterium]|nr:EamA family transporter [Steroidobacteraceae bacterium]